MAVKATVEDRADDFSAVARLFRLLVRPENFDDPARQKLVVETLLRETFPNDATIRVKVGQGQELLTQITILLMSLTIIPSNQPYQPAALPTVSISLS